MRTEGGQPQGTVVLQELRVPQWQVRADGRESVGDSGDDTDLQEDAEQLTQSDEQRAHDTAPLACAQAHEEDADAACSIRSVTGPAMGVGAVEASCLAC